MATVGSATGSAAAPATLDFRVGDDDTAQALGSGSLPVLGTPRLVAWCEAATCAAIEPGLAPGSTSVGVRVALDHLAPSPVGEHVRVTAEKTSVEGRRHTFLVTARGSDGTVLTTGEITRAVVDTERFLERLS